MNKNKLYILIISFIAFNCSSSPRYNTGTYQKPSSTNSKVPAKLATKGKNQKHRRIMKGVIRGDGIILDGKNNFIESHDHFTAVIGQSDLVVVSTEDATLVVAKDRVEEVKRIIQHLEKTKKKDLL